MSVASDKVTPSTSADRVPTGSSNNHLLPQEGRPVSESLPPPDGQGTPTSRFPSHRRKCIKWGCPSCCCSKGGFLSWVLFLILIQGGPIAVLYMDHHYSYKYGSTLERFQIEQGMETVLCQAVGIYTVNVTGSCENALPCLKIRVIVFPTDSVKPLYNTTSLLMSEREQAFERYCFNLDICEIDESDPWTEYRQKVEDYKELLSAKQKKKQSFLCYFKIKKIRYGMDYPIVIMNQDTTLWDFCLWFAFPVSGLCLCWLCIVLLCYWFCYPCDKDEKEEKEYHEINTLDGDRSDYSINSPTGGSGLGGGYPGEGDGGGWPTKGPTGGDSSAWPLYWR